jgi:hypothetical protein
MRSSRSAVGLHPRQATKLSEMAEAVSRESLSARLADVRESLSLLADYL